MPNKHFLLKLITDKYSQQSPALRGWYVFFAGIFNLLYYFVFDKNSVDDVHIRNEMLYVRAGVFVCLTIISLILIYGKPRDYFQPVIFPAGVCVGLGVLYLMQLASSPDAFHNTYLPELILIFCIAPLVAELTPFVSAVQLVILLTLYNVFVVTKLSPQNIHYAYNGNLVLFISGFYVILLRVYLQKLTASLKKQKLQTDQEKERLKRKNTELIESDAFKSKMISVLSHDVRTPLMNIRALIDLKDTLPTAAAKQLYDEKVKETAEYAYTLLNDILEWSVSQTKGIQISVSNINLHDLVADVFKLYSSAAEAKDLDLINEIPKSVVIKSDHPIMGLLLRNLISNAIKFTKFGYISVSCHRMEDKFEISVTDTGVGVKDDVILFDKNHIKSSLGTGNEKGSGFGLLLCLDYAAKINGKLHYEKNLTGGTTFSIQLPVNALQSSRNVRYIVF
jgi:signal transduction histidine kinase